jgi:hypothetical protein
VCVCVCVCLYLYVCDVYGPRDNLFLPNMLEVLNFVYICDSVYVQSPFLRPLLTHNNTHTGRRGWALENFCDI